MRKYFIREASFVSHLWYMWAIWTYVNEGKSLSGRRIGWAWKKGQKIQITQRLERSLLWLYYRMDEKEQGWWRDKIVIYTSLTWSKKKSYEIKQSLDFNFRLIMYVCIWVCLSVGWSEHVAILRLSHQKGF